MWKAFLVVLLAVSHLHYCILMTWPIWPHLLIMVRICPISDSTAKIQSALHTHTTHACAHMYTTIAYTHALYHYIYTHTPVCTHYTTLHTSHYAHHTRVRMHSTHYSHSRYYLCFAIVCVCVCTFVVYVVMLGGIEILMHNENRELYIMHYYHTVV